MRELDKTLSHYGIPGMKWGVRRARSSSTGRVGPSEDAAKASTYKATARKHGVSALSNDQLRELTKRLELENKYGQWAANNPTLKKRATKYITDLLVEEGMVQLGLGPKSKDGAPQQSQLKQVADAFKKAFNKPKVTVRPPQNQSSRKTKRKSQPTGPFRITSM